MPEIKSAGLPKQHKEKEENTNNIFKDQNNPANKKI